jgi:hypothetical protein
MVIGSSAEQEGSLTVERHWIAGSEGQLGLFLQYVPYGAKPGVNLFSGQCFKGEVVYYPSAAPLRMAIRNHALCNTLPGIPSIDGWDAVVQRETDALSHTPFSTALPYVVAALRPVKSADSVCLIEDNHGKQMRLQEGFADIWKWMALSGGAYLSTAVLGSEHTYRPLGVWHDNTYISLS